MSRVRVCREDELQPGDRVHIVVDGTPVGVLNIDGRYYALENECAHRGGPVCKGRVHSGRVDGVGEAGREGRGGAGGQLTIVCPWHGWKYDLTSGRHLGVTDNELATFAVSVEERIVYLER